MKFIVQYSKYAKLIASSFTNLVEEDVDKFKFLLACKAKELKTNDQTVYKIK